MDFRVLGPIEVDVDGTTPDLGGPQQRVVLASLVLRANEVVSTDVLRDAIWGDGAPSSAVAVVRTYVSRLRRVLALAGRNPLVSRAPGYVLRIDPDQVDAHRFESLMSQARVHRRAGRPDQASTMIDEALRLWRGDALADLAEWPSLEPAIVRLRELRLTALEDRIDADLDRGHHARVVGELEALSRAHPFRERIWGQLIVALYRSNRQADALATYQAARSTLVGQMGIEPGPELQALEQSVLAHSDELLWRPVPEHPAAGGHSSAASIPLQAALTSDMSDEVLVGRHQERAVLQSYLDDLDAGEFRVVFVAGPPGIGKTALARWFARRAHAAGSTVLFGRADEDAGVPFQALQEALDHWVVHAGLDEVASFEGSDAAHLARVLPRLAERRPDLAAVPTSDTQAARRRSFDALLTWIEKAAARRPLVVILDDLHWADAATLAALRHALRHPPRANAVVLATYRDTDLDRAPELATVAASLDGDGRVRHLDLVGLNEREVSELVHLEAEYQPRAESHRFAGDLGRRTGGNPLFVLETVRHLLERGVISATDETWPNTATLEGLGVPARVTELITRRLDRLPPPTAALLRSASVLGEEFDVAVLSRTAGSAEIEVIDALEPALVAGLVTPNHERADRFAFTHALIREAILAGLPVSRRSQLHWQAGQALAMLGAQAEHRLGEIARHLTAGVRSGDADMAIAANVRAGQHSLSTLAFEDARDRFTTATELLETAPDVAPELAFDAWVGLGRAASALSDASLRSAYQRAAAIAWREQWSQRLVTAALGLAGYHLELVSVNPVEPTPPTAGVDDTPSEAAVVGTALAVVAERPSVEGCLLLALQAINAVIFGERGDATDQARVAADMAERLDSPSATAAALLAHGWSLVGTPRATELRTTVERVLSLPMSADAFVVVMTYLVPLLAAPALQEGNRAELAELRRRVTDRPELWGIHSRSVVRCWDAVVALSSGCIDDAMRLIDGYPEAPEWTGWWATAEFQRGTADVERGRYRELKEPVERILSWRPSSAMLRSGLAFVCAAMGDVEEASHHVQIVRAQRLDEMGGGAPRTFRLLAELAARLADVDLARDLLPHLSGYEGQMLVPFGDMAMDGAADRAIGQALLTLGQLDEAVDRFARAEAFERSFGAVALATRTVYWHAAARLRRDGPGDRRSARILLDRARSDAQRLGMAGLLEDVDRLIDTTVPL